jgi:hypothetical protein
MLDGREPSAATFGLSRRVRLWDCLLKMVDITAAVWPAPFAMSDAFWAIPASRPQKAAIARDPNDHSAEPSPCKDF